MPTSARFFALSRRAGAFDVPALAADPRVTWAAAYRREPLLEGIHPHFRRGDYVEAVEVESPFPPAGGDCVYRVEPRCLLARSEPVAPGAWMVAPMRRSPGLDREEFAEHWFEEHGPLALAHHTGVIEYRQNVVCERLGEGPELDGIALLGFSDRETFERELFDSPEGRRALAEDMARFVDVDDLAVLLAGEYAIKR